MKRIIRIGSRDSKLAVAQSLWVMDRIRQAHPEVQLELVTMKTTGDRILDRSLQAIGGKGLFVKELDRALQAGEVDYTVHSLKDMPMQQPEGLPILAFSRREDPRDAWILPEGAQEPDSSLPIGCGSLRRTLQLQELFPHLKIEGIRGNVQTRLAKLDSGQYCATVLACAGIRRLGMEHRISRIFSTEEMIPAAGQGILAVQGRAGEDHSILTCVDDAEGRACALAERAFVRELDGGCVSPVAAYAQVKEGKLHLTGLYQSEDGQQRRKGNIEGQPAQAEELGRTLAQQLRA